jgi:Mg/Co/Ni transporter MgtE
MFERLPLLGNRLRRLWEKGVEVSHRGAGETLASVPPPADELDQPITLYATGKFMRMPPATMARGVLDNYRQLALDKDVVVYVYVVAPDGHLIGVVDIRDLIKADSTQSLANIMTKRVVSIYESDKVKEALELFDHFGFRALPVVDINDRIVSVVSFKDIRGKRSLQ